MSIGNPRLKRRVKGEPNAAYSEPHDDSTYLVSSRHATEIPFLYRTTPWPVGSRADPSRTATETRGSSDRPLKERGATRAATTRNWRVHLDASSAKAQRSDAEMKETKQHSYRG